MSAGDLLLFAAVAVSAIGYAFSGRLTASMPGWEVISWALVIALPISIPAAWFTLPADILQLPTKPMLGLFYVALFSQWIGFFAWNAGLAMGGIARVSQVQLLQPMMSLVWASLFLHEHLDALMRLGPCDAHRRSFGPVRLALHDATGGER